MKFEANSMKLYCQYMNRLCLSYYLTSAKHRLCRRDDEDATKHPRLQRRCERHTVLKHLQSVRLFSTFMKTTNQTSEAACGDFNDSDVKIDARLSDSASVIFGKHQQERAVALNVMKSLNTLRTVWRPSVVLEKQVLQMKRNHPQELR